TITNGRMLAYPDFVRRAVEAGLDEVTFSLHGHDADLHDSLTGVPGSFVQTNRGIRNAVASGRLIVSGDVVINRRNVTHLRQVMEHFIRLGVREIDLLMVVPFGRATPGDGDSLMVDAADALAPLHRALQLTAEPGLMIWTNRLDPRLLEGFESLIQDPHKLHDEVRGRRHLFDQLLDGGAMRCVGDRCTHCFIRPLCEQLGAAAAELRAGVPNLLRVDTRGPSPTPAARALLETPRRWLWVRARNAAEVVTLPGAAAARALWLSLDDHRGLLPALEAAGLPHPTRLLPPDASQLEAALALTPPELVVTVGAETAPLLPALKPAGPTRVLLAPVAE
ncbi:MAG: radical SAM protein, partial [Myxococcota bacterium]|nr:radical SAM protein [Myxococcota bacterium]